jgi:glycosyltransferase involved in cell wall biosynthesis
VDRSKLLKRGDERKIMSNIIVSFCISTYNRSERVFSLVNSILSCDRDDIEVAVVDNNSTDNTFDLLHTISDLRFHYYKNERNIGDENFVRSLTYAKGKYAFYCNDRDFIITENIPKLCSFLYQNKLSFIYCNGSFYLNKDIIYTNKYTAFINLYKPTHPTGVIFNTEYLGKIGNLKWFEKQDFLSFMYLAGKICLLDNSAQLKNVYWKLAEKEFLLNNKSGLTPSSTPLEEFWFHPQYLLKILIRAGNYVISLNAFSKTDNQKILYKEYIYYSKQAIFGFKGYMYDEYNCKHYGIEPRKYTNRELYKLYRKFYIGYKNSNLFSSYSSVFKYRLFFFNVLMFIRIHFYSLKIKRALKICAYFLKTKMEIITGN